MSVCQNLIHNTSFTSHWSVKYSHIILSGWSSLVSPGSTNFIENEKIGSIRVARSGKENLIYVNKTDLLTAIANKKSVLTIHSILSGFLQETLDIVHNLVFLF